MVYWQVFSFRFVYVYILFMLYIKVNLIYLQWDCVFFVKFLFVNICQSLCGSL